MTGRALAQPLLSKAAMQLLHDATELDYMTHIVFRMYENKRCAPVGKLSPDAAQCIQRVLGRLLPCGACSLRVPAARAALTPCI